jgi:AraC-like DNA-binding protein
MTWDVASDVGRIVAGSHVLLVVMLLGFRMRSRERLYSVFMGLGGATALFLPVMVQFQLPPAILLPALILQSGGSFWFWLFAISQGRDSFKPNWKHWSLLALKVFLTVFWLSKSNRLIMDISPEEEFVWRAMVPALMTLGFAVAAVWASARNLEDELAESRLIIRRIVVFWGAGSIVAIIGITLVFRGPILGNVGDWLTVCLALAICTNIHFWLLRSQAPEAESDKGTAPQNPELKDLARRIETLFREEQYFVTEGLTVNQLAAHLSQKDYKVRRAINGVLGYRNFNAFLNQYRVEAARKRLIEEPDLPVIRLAMDLGYRSLAVFNKVFKETTGRTPSDYRRAEKAD